MDTPTTLFEQSPEYPAKVSSYLAKNNQRRLPWGFLVANDGHLTATRSPTLRRQRTELGEVAIALLYALGVDLPTLEEIALLPWNATEAELLAKLQDIRSRQQLVTQESVATPAAPVDG